MNDAVPLLHVIRGGLLESVHRGALAVVEEERTVHSLGDLGRPVYYRSASKPLQALVGVTSGAADAFGLTSSELAVAAGSHSARPEHLAAVQSILDKAGVPESALGCGGHYALDPDVARRQGNESETPRPLWSNCSGKHALMLATARHLGLPLDTVLERDHPVQRTIRAHVAAFAAVSEAEVHVGVDGCGAPAFAVPLEAMARSLARFGAPDALEPTLAAAARRVTDAMLRHPDMVAGPGRFDTEVMRAAATPLVAKAGAEGVHGAFVPSRRLGVAIKVDDGSDRGYRLVVLGLLERLGLLGATAARDLAERFADPVLRSLDGRPVGRLEIPGGTPADARLP